MYDEPNSTTSYCVPKFIIAINKIMIIYILSFILLLLNNNGEAEETKAIFFSLFNQILAYHINYSILIVENVSH
jgi:hypothetical protein